MKNKKNALWALLLMFLMPSVAGAQIAAFEEWAKNPSGKLVEQEFAVAALDKAACDRAAEIVDSLWMKETAKRLYGTWGNMTISHDSIKLSCAVRTFGLMPKDGRSLYISMNLKRVFTLHHVHHGTHPTCGIAKGSMSCLKI